LCSICME